MKSWLEQSSLSNKGSPSVSVPPVSQGKLYSKAKISNTTWVRLHVPRPFLPGKYCCRRASKVSRKAACSTMTPFGRPVEALRQQYFPDRKGLGTCSLTHVVF